MESSSNKLTFIKLLWIFVLGSIAGYIIETSFYLLKHGVFLNKQGLLYGPLKPIYGTGACLLTMSLYFLKEKSKLVIFLVGSLIGAVFEYICSLALEYILGTRMWSYANMGMNIHGRVFIPYIPMWGIIALVWLKIIYPTFNKIYSKVPRKPLYIISLLLGVFLLYDILISSFAANRMSERAHNIPATTKFERYLDRHFPDEYIIKRVPYIKVVE